MAGKKISRANLARIQQIADHAHAMGAKGPAPDATPIKAMSLGEQLEAVVRAVMHAEDAEGFCFVEEVYDASVIIEISTQNHCTYWQAGYTIGDDGITLTPRAEWTQVEEVWQPVSTAAKAGALLAADEDDIPEATMKAIGDRTLELRVAWGYDGHKEQFHPERTDFDLENYPTPPVAYYHGYKADGKQAPKPIYIGKTLKRENRADGHYLTVKLNKKPEADKVWDAAFKGEGYVSPGTVGHLRRKDPDGTLTYWPIAEISAWDGAPNRKQAHPASLAFPVLKALYAEAGIQIPDTLAPTPEAAGDAAGSSGHADSTPLTPDEMQAIAAQIVTDSLRTYRKETTR